MIAALFVQADGIYSGLPNVELWPENRDARTYQGPWPVVAHPPCERWGRYWHGSPVRPHMFKKGDDGGCFASALASVQRWGGVLEHPAYSHAWLAHQLPWPVAEGWQQDINGGWCCSVEQGWYGHFARKPTWLYAFGAKLPELNWSTGKQRLDERHVARLGYEKARRSGALGFIGGKDKTKIRGQTPAEFRDILLTIAASVAQQV